MSYYCSFTVAMPTLAVTWEVITPYSDFVVFVSFENLI